MAEDHATMQSSWSQVRESCKQVLKADPDRMAEIVAQWSAFVENNPSPWGYTLLGIFEQESGHFSNASAAFDKTHQIEPTYPTE
jgi:cytochrome c-type biogenesis protein CcmH/NrfG